MPRATAWETKKLPRKFVSKTRFQSSQVTSRLESRSEEHTSELQSRLHLVCRLLLEKKKNNICFHIQLIIIKLQVVNPKRHTLLQKLLTFIPLLKYANKY